MCRALVAIGSNLGDRRAQLEAAVALLRATAGIEVAAVSHWYETAPVGGPGGQGPFLNGALLLKTSLTPVELHQQLHRVELELGRQRDVRWQARLLDLDLLLFDQQVIAGTELTVPHPRMAFRRFVLEPAAEVARDMVHPLTGWRIDELLANLNKGRPYVAITGVPGVGKTRMARALAAELGGSAILQPAADSEAAPEPAVDDEGRHDVRRELHFLDALARQLRPADFPSAAVVAVSDFWFDQTLAYARLRLDPAEFSEFRAAESLCRQSAPAPSLVVLLTTANTALGGPDSTRLPLDRARLQNGLGELVLRRGVGPVLELSADDPPHAWQEVRAAVVAML